MTISTTLSYAAASACTACIISVSPLTGALLGVAAYPSTNWGGRAVHAIDNFIGRCLHLPSDGATKKALVVASFALALLGYCYGVGLMLSAAGYALSLKEIAILTLVPALSWLLVSAHTSEASQIDNDEELNMYPSETNLSHTEDPQVIDIDGF